MQQSNRDVTDGLLSVSSAHYGDEVVIVSFAGELDRAVVSTAAAAVEDAFNVGARRLVLDLQKLEFLDSSGVALLRRVAVKDVPGCDVLVIPSDSPGVSRVLAATGMDSLLRFATEPHSVAVV
ncbi:MAG: Anti-sigma factor antagonist [Solirubrobacterales bacterium]|nr:Anti-sigma factor antagonist [Solirubrobacterales bacterium]